MAQDTPEFDDDSRLVARCATGDRSAWIALVDRYQRLVYAIVMRAGLDEHAAADVFQIVFTRLFEGIGTLREPERLHAWIATTAKREALRQRARVRPDTADALDHIEDAAPLAEDALAELQERHRVRLAYERLDTRCRRLLGMLFSASGQRPDYASVARELDMPVGAIGPTRARCIAKLRALID